MPLAPFNELRDLPARLLPLGQYQAADGADVVDLLTEIPLRGRTFHASSDLVVASTPMAIPAFVAGSENRLVAYTAGQLMQSAGPQQREDGLRRTSMPSVVGLFGPSGVGKTHLARGLVAYWQQHCGRETAEYLAATDFRRRFSDAVNCDAVVEFRDRLRNRKLLAIDDIHQLPERPAVQLEMRHTLDALEENGALVVVTSHRSPDTLGSLSPDIQSRLAAGLLLQLATPGREAREHILHHATNALGCTLSQQAIQRLSSHLSGTAPMLFAALFELLAAESPSDQRSSALHDVDCADHLLAGRHRYPTVQRILAIVAKHCSLPQKQIKSGSRKRAVVRARGIVCYLARECAAASYEQIGRALGGRDHTTIMHSHQKIEGDRQCDPSMQETLAELRRVVERS